MTPIGDIGATRGPKLCGSQLMNAAAQSFSRCATHSLGQCCEIQYDHGSTILRDLRVTSTSLLVDVREHHRRHSPAPAQARHGSAPTPSRGRSRSWRLYRYDTFVGSVGATAPVNAKPRLRYLPRSVGNRRQPNFQRRRRPTPLRSMPLRFFALPCPSHRVIARIAQDARPVTECPEITGDSWVRELIPSFGKIRYR